MNRSPSAAKAARMPPSCLSGFDCEALSAKESGLDPSVDFALSCKQCGAKTFRILGFPLVAPDPSPYYMVKHGETIFRPPHRAECASCGKIEALFDARTQGYDGVLNGGCAYESGSEGEAHVPGQFNLIVSLSYNIELDELQELAAEAAVNPSDLFDAFCLFGESTDDDEEQVELCYECA